MEVMYRHCEESIYYEQYLCYDALWYEKLRSNIIGQEEVSGKSYLVILFESCTLLRLPELNSHFPATITSTDIEKQRKKILF